MGTLNLKCTIENAKPNESQEYILDEKDSIDRHVDNLFSKVDEAFEAALDMYEFYKIANFLPLMDKYASKADKKLVKFWLQIIFSNKSDIN